MSMYWRLRFWAALAMSALTTATILILIHLKESTVTVQNVPDGGITCQAGTFTSGNPASVTCFFNTDVFQTKRDFIVQKYRLDHAGSDTGSTTPFCFSPLVHGDLMLLSQQQRMVQLIFSADFVLRWPCVVDRLVISAL